MKHSLWLIAVYFGIVGCVPRVSLPAPPPPEASEQARVAAYEQLAPIGSKSTVTLHGPAVISSQVDFLLLRGGYRVYHPSDLLPAVDETSVTAHYVREFEAHKRIEDWLAIGSIVGIVGGIALLAIPASSRDQNAGTILPSAIVGGLGFASMFGGLIMNRIAADDRASAFMSYDQSLRERLRLNQQRTPPPAATPDRSARLLPSATLWLAATSAER
jgi:hypothetical protein